MKPPDEPGRKTARATCETTESVELGSACTCTARYETPRNIPIASVPSTASVVAAFFPCGWRNALTPFAIASTPVRAVEPQDEARCSAEVLARHDVRAAARLVHAHRLPVREHDDPEQAGDPDRDREDEMRGGRRDGDEDDERRLRRVRDRGERVGGEDRQREPLRPQRRVDLA